MSIAKLGGPFATFMNNKDFLQTESSAAKTAYQKNQDVLRSEGKAGFAPQSSYGRAINKNYTSQPVSAFTPSSTQAALHNNIARPRLVPSYKKGTKRVPKTGVAMLHKDEAVLNKSEAKRYRAGGLALGGKKKAPKSAKAKTKIKKTMDEWKSGTLHSGSKKGPKVTNQKQAVAIALSQARKEGLK